MIDSLLLKLVTDGVDYPIGQQAKEEVGIGAFIFLMIDGTQFQVRFQLTVGRFYLSNKVVIFPC